jgi:hypothetical protein
MGGEEKKSIWPPHSHTVPRRLTQWAAQMCKNCDLFMLSGHEKPQFLLIWGDQSVWQRCMMRESVGWLGFFSSPPTPLPLQVFS